MSLRLVEQALHTHLTSMPPGIDVAWPGLRYEPKPGAPYIRVEALPAPVAVQGQLIGVDAPVRRNGTYILTALYPLRHGPGPLLNKIDALEARFARRQRLTAGTGQGAFIVHISSVSRGQLITADNWNSLPLRVRWFCRHP